MGMAKRYMEKIQARGFDAPDDRYVCYNCFEDEGIIKYIHNNAHEYKCDYCGKNSDHFISITLEEVLEHIMNSIKAEWYIPEDSGTPFESKEGGWLVEPTEIDEILQGIDSIDACNDELFDDINESIHERYWMKFFSMPYPELDFIDSWKRFSDIIKYEMRFFFYNKDVDHTQFESASYAFDDPREILELISETIKEIDIIKSLPKYTTIYRVRCNRTKKYEKASELCAPPAKNAIFSNRMSPAGIPMFYGADDYKTSIAETCSQRESSEIISVAKFKTMKNLYVIDFTDLPEIPSIYDEDNRDKRTPIKFMNEFLEDFVKPIPKDGREHIEYVPTQVVTEFLKNFSKYDYPINGIRYTSTTSVNGKSYVLFINNDNCFDSYEYAENNILYLENVYWYDSQQFIS